MTTDEIIKKHGIIKYNGKLIFPDKNKFHFWVRGRRLEGLNEAKWYIDTYVKPNYTRNEFRKTVNKLCHLKKI